MKSSAIYTPNAYENGRVVTIARLNETRFGPKKRRPQYILAQKISTLFDALDEREIAR
jgi:hypothetical protein